ncbi:MAG: hypothetical protein WC833_07915 [Bacteroidales bacterium]|jgi:hypothetical protein
MRKFILSCIIFSLIGCSLIVIITSYLALTDRYKFTVAGSEIYRSIFKSKQKNKTKKIIIGDSVGNQLFPNTTNDDTINSLTCNQAVSMVGHFILLNNYLNAGNKVDTVVLIYSPSSFRNNLNQIYTFHYFLKPFYIDEYKPLFTKKVTEQIKKIPYSNFCRFSVVLTSNWAPNFISTDTIKYSFLSPISIEYITKIKDLSNKHNFKLIILPTPIRFNGKSDVEGIDKNEILNNGLATVFENYFENIIFLHDSCFLDGTHLKSEYVKNYSDYYRNKLMR